jgi:hypothetical protein
MSSELHEALEQIAAIRQQMARTELFRGYRAAPVAFSGLLAVVAAVAQSLWLPAPGENLGAYLALWIGAAVLSATAAAAGMIDRRRRAASAWNREVTSLAIEQFAPSVLAGLAVTAVIATKLPELAGLLPGLWQIFFSLGIFASSRLLPAPIRLVAGWYLATGVACLAASRGVSPLSPWAMGVPFGLGQVAIAAILYWTLERRAGAEAPR